MYIIHNALYTIWQESLAGRKFGKFGMIHQTKTIQISTYIYNLVAESIHLPNLFLPNAQDE